MSNQELRDLLHERVADVTMPDLSDAAWSRARRIRRGRAAAAVAGTVAAVAVVAVAVSGGPGAGRSTGPVTQLPSPSGPTSTGPTPSDPAPTQGTQGPDSPSTGPDGAYRGWPVYWGPSESQERGLPRVDSPFPETIDLSASAPSVEDEPVRSALAAYALIDRDGGVRLLLLAPDGSLRSVDTSRVAPYDDGAGDDISVAHDSLLSPTGEYLAFPQVDGVLVLTLATGEWRTVHVGDAPTTTLQWMGNTDLWLPPTTQGGDGPMYSVLDGRRSGGTNTAAPAGALGAGAAPYGRWRMGPLGTAQSWGGVAGMPLPSEEDTSAQVVLVDGFEPADDALMVLSTGSMPEGDPRPDHCCAVLFWLDGGTVVHESQTQPRRLVAWRVGTHDFGRVTSIEGYDPDRELVVSSYARIWDR